MDRINRKLIKPESTLIEKTALELAATFYEIGRGQGLTSKYKNPKAYAKRHVKEFIPKAVELLMDIMANPKTPQAQRDAIYDAFLERANDVDLANTIPIFDNPLAATFKADNKPDPIKPLVINSPKKNTLDALPLSQMLHDGVKHNG